MSNICGIRIDERLIHGQVATFWQGSLGFSRIIVVDEESSKDQMMKTVLKIACPYGTKLSVLDAEKAARNIINQKYTEKLFIICKSPKTLLELIGYGLEISEVTVGNMSNGIGKKKISKSIFVLPVDIRDFKELDAKGIKLSLQMVPTDSPEDFNNIISRELESSGN